MSTEPVVPISAIEHFAYCPRQCALIHCDGVWTDNEHTIRGTRKHRSVDSGAHRREHGRMDLRSIPLWSKALGLSDRADAVEIDDDNGVHRVEYIGGDAARIYFRAVSLVVALAPAFSQNPATGQ